MRVQRSMKKPPPTSSDTDILVGVAGLESLGTFTEKKVGDVAVLKTKQRYVYYLITKKASYQKPTYENLQSSLEAMKEHCLKHGISRISMPRIGCGLDQLKWERVSKIIQEVFKNTDIIITVYSLEAPAKFATYTKR
ncbi:ADP-ribose glycohydrolase OARD1-like isoform X3 [Chiloscyllium punctatum]|uniref:ADP-ribose glycohydrolase OARD1-like isoform X3 n=1 Tax=Chiloscyllium punctatum TaxID=137246 RepID=UPI003B637669